MTSVLAKPTAPAHHGTTRWSLIRRLKGGTDEQAWQEFYETYRRLLRSLALRAGLTAEEADDAVQDTVTSVFRKLPQFEADPSAGSFKNWLFQLARWRIANQFQKRSRFEEHRFHRRRPAEGDEASDTATVERVGDPAFDGLQNVWDEEWKNEALSIALEKLKHRVRPAHFQIFYLHVIKQRSTGEVAKALGVSAAYVYLVKCRLLPLFKRLIRNLESRPM